ncbi:hypothetical protein [Paenibacillus aceris]|uniref:Uncharacterized protein n=1 Tax=Paenibacillus aceris TaxID=869555 RepID=A0ABS4I4P5_9BACL|nr:hypothetical protein [Paenibacillus aceris]
MIHFSFDDIRHRPEICRMLLQLVIGPNLIRNSLPSALSPDEKEVLRLAIHLSKPIRPIDLISQCGHNFRTARKRLLSLAEKGLLRPIGHGKVVRYYELKEDAWHYLL